MRTASVRVGRARLTTRRRWALPRRTIAAAGGTAVSAARGAAVLTVALGPGRAVRPRFALGVNFCCVWGGGIAVGVPARRTRLAPLFTRFRAVGAMTGAMFGRAVGRLGGVGGGRLGLLFGTAEDFADKFSNHGANRAPCWGARGPPARVASRRNARASEPHRRPQSREVCPARPLLSTVGFREKAGVARLEGVAATLEGRALAPPPPCLVLAARREPTSEDRRVLEKFFNRVVPG